MTEDDFIKAYDTWADAIFRHCYFHVHDREAAKDLTQDVFLRVWEYVSRGGSIQSPKAFLYRVANNRIIDEYRKGGRYESLDELADEAGFDVPDEDSEEKVLDSLDARLALRALPRLPENYRTVLIMRFVDDLPPREIADIIGESENNVSVRIHRAVRALAHTIKKENHG